MNRNQAILHRLRQQAESYDRRQAMAQKRAPVMGLAKRYDEPVLDEDGKPMESHCLSDNGHDAAIIREAGEVPRWKTDLAAILASYGEVERKRIAAIVDFDNLSDAARALNVSRMTLYRLKDELKGRLGEVWLKMRKGE